jgi:hypothetical protein
MMNIGQIPQASRPKPLKFPIRDTPHCTIETNRTCNIRCRSCYNLSRGLVKSLDDVKQEIQTALRKRNLGIITLMGGEPTLHPHLREIIAFIKSRKLACQLLTNGLVLLQDDKNELLNGLKISGIDRILVHIDNGQAHVHSDLEGSRQKLFSKLEERKTSFSLSLTIYNEDQGQLPDLVCKYSQYRYFDGILAVLARDPFPPKVQKADLFEEYKSISQELRVEPLAYIPSNWDDHDVHWLVYFYFINASTGKAFGLSPTFYGIFKKFYRWLKGRQLFVVKIKPSLAGLIFLLAGLAESILQPRRIMVMANILKSSNFAKAIRFHYLAIQTPPEFNLLKNQYQLCYHCPDATIRNGKLTPVCIADFINPLDHDQANIDQKRYQTAYHHLEEI